MPARLASLLFVFSAMHGIGRGAASVPRRILRPKDNVGEMIKRDRQKGVKEGVKDRYTIHTEIESGSENAGMELAMDVVEAVNPAVTHETIIIDERGNAFTAGDDDTLLYTLLVTDVDTADGADTFALLALNPENDDMHGIVEKKGRRGERIPYKIKQSRGENNGVAMAQEEVNLPPSDWHCDVAEEIQVGEEEIERRLTDIKNDHQHEHRHTQHQDPNLSTMESLTESLRGVKSNPLNKARRLQSAGYKYQVDMFVEIDNAFISNLGGLNYAINYVNTLVTGANVVYEKEIDTHLRVTNIKVSSLYDGATSTNDALNIMRANYANSNTWHSANTDLHHALLGGIGGGIAYIGVLCSSNWGFGLTGGLSGSFVSMGEPTVWDMKGFMHEVGHNFGSGHTHDTKYYNPVIDGCGISCPSSNGYGWSTIMSYCQWCPGSYNNVMYSFGADYDGSGDVNDLMNWPPNPNMVANYDSSHYSVSPEREAQKMYLHVDSKAPTGCVALSSPAPQTPKPTSSPTSSFGVAFYDSSLGAPKCSKVTSFCDSGALLNSRGGLSGMSEPNAPNTLDSCTDGPTGSYHTDESVDSIKVSAVGSGYIQPGATILIEARVWAYSPTTDFVDFFYANDATSPQWQLINTVKPAAAYANTLSAQYTLGNGSLQAVRVVIRYNGAASPCPGGSYDDVDDLAFAVVQASITTKPSIKPTTPPTPLPTRLPTAHPTPPPTPLPSRPPTALPTPPPSRIPTGQPTQLPTPPASTPKPSSKPSIVQTLNPATLAPVTTPSPTVVGNQAGNTDFDFDLGVPKCSTTGSFCDSGNLLNSRDSISEVSEPNGSNALDSCTDGTAGSYHVDESVDGIKISSVGGGEFQAGAVVQVDATVWAYNPAADYADFFYAKDVTQPQWQLIDTVKPTSPGANIVSAQFALEEGPSDLQAVRVVFRVNGVASACPTGNYDDVDDMVFVVKTLQSASSPTQSPALVLTSRPTLFPKTSKFAKTLFTSSTWEN